MYTVNELLQMKEQVKQKEKKKMEIEAEIKMVKKSIREDLGFKSIKAAEKDIPRLEDKIDALNAEIEELTEDVNMVLYE